ncbi:MAG: DUF2330 domain-containing protein [Fuerstiella sp.]
MKQRPPKPCQRQRAASILPLIVLFAGSLFPAGFVVADPCGMVPPIYIEGDVPIERIGRQKTFVFYKDGVETFVIRPGFQGTVSEFGMLIPFPSPPALRKVADDTFAHIAAAIDPPEIVVDLTPRLYERFSDGFSAMPDAAMSAPEETDLAFDEVAVLRQEAVGMYEVAVLKAGSAAALNRWMTDHGYRYPDGMDDVCNDYVADRWCFVAIKARVGQKDGVDPKPGMENTNAALPEGATFDGYVQGMGFRFRSEELVVPMRLSAFNKGDLHNVVYLLTDRPMKARDLPAGHVVRQISGVDLLHNVTQPLPLRIIGGEFEDIPENRRQQLVHQRNPEPHNGIARDLFAGDLLAASSGTLSHPHEELEKQLLEIGERLHLRGPELDSLHHAELQTLQKELTKTALSSLASMTMTVIDGDFDRQIVAADNVYFTGFEMNPARNSVKRYNARLFGPSDEGAPLSSAAEPLSSAPKTVAVTHPTQGRLLLQEAATGQRAWWLRLLAAVALTITLIAVLVVRGRRRHVAGLLLLSLLTADSVAQEKTGGESDEQVTVEQLSGMLTEMDIAESRAEVIEKVRRLNTSAVAGLLQLVRTNSRMERRGWAVVCLSEIGGKEVSDGLKNIAHDASLPPLVRTWAGAAMVNAAGSLQQLVSRAQLTAQLPALRRPLRLRLTRLIAEADQQVDMAELLQLSAVDAELQQLLAPVLLQTEPAKFARVLMTGAEVSIRQQAAAWLATLKSQHVPGVNQAVIAAITFDREAADVPWGDGPLFIPGVNWNRPEAIALINELTAWYVWSVAQEQPEQEAKITTNLNSRQLMSAAGYQQVPGAGLPPAAGTQYVTQWLAIWTTVIGREQMEQLMTRTGYRFSPATFEPQ